MKNNSNNYNKIEVIISQLIKTLSRKISEIKLELRKKNTIAPPDSNR